MFPIIHLFNLSVLLPRSELLKSIMVFRSDVAINPPKLLPLLSEGPLLDDIACNANVLQRHNFLAANNPNISRTSFMRERVSEMGLCQRIPDSRPFRVSWNYKGTLVLGPHTLSEPFSPSPFYSHFSSRSS